MAVKPATMTTDGKAVVVQWTDLDVGDTGSPAKLSGYPNRSAQVVGTATAIPFEGSNDGVTWFPLKDKSNTVISLDGLTSEINAIQETTLWVRPGVVVGGANSVVTLVAV